MISEIEWNFAARGFLILFEISRRTCVQNKQIRRDETQSKGKKLYRERVVVCERKREREGKRIK